jgi:hypothetical protein
MPRGDGLGREDMWRYRARAPQLPENLSHGAQAIVGQSSERGGVSSTATAWRYVNETVHLLAGRAPKLGPRCGRRRRPATRLS